MNKIDGEVAHPVVRVHPETGERCLFVSPMFTSHVVGMPPSESDELLAELHEHCAEERFVYEHHWKVGETVLWDNRSTMQCVSSLEKSLLAQKLICARVVCTQPTEAVRRRSTALEDAVAWRPTCLTLRPALHPPGSRHSFCLANSAPTFWRRLHTCTDLNERHPFTTS